MARRSRAETLIQEYEGVEDNENKFIVVYDFLGFKPSKRFWENLHRLSEEDPVSGLIQYSVYRANGLKKALAVNRLAIEYGAATMMFIAEEYHA